ncbi:MULTISPECIES: hypothetical protein [unclassified Yoonia]|uniref:hypothetical protein n=1 Tax=unclassified Yoonia TaxID=2629118 RepID=UPI002AFE75CA|nr:MULTISPECIES: hypothetical protein [unclassified Yoonia]
MIAFWLVCLQDLPDPERMADGGWRMRGCRYQQRRLIWEICSVSIVPGDLNVDFAFQKS